MRRLVLRVLLFTECFPFQGAGWYLWESEMKRTGGFRGGGSGFGKRFRVFSFSRPTGAAYLLGGVLMHCVLVYSGQGGTVGAASAASETDHLECHRLALRECNRET